MVNYLSQQDYNDYGDELIDLTKRAAAEALSPELQRIEQQNHQLQRWLGVEARHRMDAEVERAVPDFREIDRDPRWHAWLSSVDQLSGRVRQEWLNDAISQGAINRVIRFFQEFKQQHQGAGQASARSEAAIGRHVYTPVEIGRLYERRRKGEFDDATWQRLEADIFAAQKQGRVQVNYMTK